MSNLPLTPAQHAILAHATEHTGGKIEWFPDHIKGGARKKVLEGLFNKALITGDSTDWFVAAEGYDALGRARPAPAPLNADPEIEAAVTAAEAEWVKEKASEQARTQPRTHENSKQANVIRMLQRTEGATLAQLMQATGWLAHTVRGTLAGALKKKLRLNVVSEKVADTDRVYRILP